MSDRTPFDDVADDVDDGADLPPELLAALADESTWTEVPIELEEAIVATIVDEAGASAESATTDEPSGDTVSAPPADADVVDLSSRRRWRTFGLTAAAAAVVIIAGAVIVSTVGGSGDGPEFELALEATELAPGASADVGIDTTPLGTRIVLDVRDVPPAPPGSYYEAWLRIDAETGVSAGTFHLRGGDGEIELWAGVTVDDYPLFTITLQDEGGGAASSGRVILRGVVEP